MPPTFALLLWLILLLLLLCFDPAKERSTSVALWVPLVWIFFIATRLPSQWIQGNVYAAQATSLEEGNPVDRSISLFLILLAVVVLLARGFNWQKFFTRNLFLTALLAFALVSVVWSDFPFVAFKRWFRDLGNYFMILVVLTDPKPVAALQTLLRRLSYLTLPLSVMLIKYFPYLARHYDAWSGMASTDGATTSKNMLGVLCLVTGMFLFWDTVTRWSQRKELQTKRILAVNLCFILMDLWLLNLANSATSRVCLALGCLVIWAVRSDWGHRHATLIKVAIPSAFLLYLILAFGFDLNGKFASQVGRDPTLTDRTLIWKTVLSLHTNPLVGTGYESFWLGPRLDRIWAVAGHVNEAHNGYLEVYLNLGVIGVCLLLGFLLASYYNICKSLGTSSTLASLNIAIWTVMLFYNMTEAAFRSQLIWLIFLFVAVAVPEPVKNLNPEFIVRQHPDTASKVSARKPGSETRPLTSNYRPLITK
jgi:exopolysaccharide production protein ExoQ